MSIIETMVVVAIIGTLSVMGRQTYRHFEIKSRYAASNLTMASVRSAIMGARLAERKTLMEITLNHCNFCAMNLTAGRDLSTMPPVQTTLTAAAWTRLGFTQNPVDGWGIAIILDENELEQGDRDCRHDSMWTAGADNTWSGAGSGQEVYGDDLIMRIPFYKQSEDCR